MYSYLRLQVQVTPTGQVQRARGLRGLKPSPLTAPRLRRVLGKCMIESFCPYGVPICQERPPGTPPAQATERCTLAGSCPYGVLFARSRHQRPPFAIFLSPKAGDGGSEVIELTLFDEAWHLYPWALATLRQALELDGLGKLRQRWRLEQVFKVLDNGRQHRLCGHDLSYLPPTLRPETFDLTLNRYLPSDPLTIELLSPTRLIRDGRLLPRDQPVPFDLLIARILDRFRELYGDRASELLRPTVRAEIEAAAAEVPLLACKTRWIEVKDYSARYDSELFLGGLTGRIRYGEPASRFLPLLRAGEVLHLGKNPTSGCGRMRIEPPVAGLTPAPRVRSR